MAAAWFARMEITAAQAGALDSMAKKAAELEDRYIDGGRGLLSMVGDVSYSKLTKLGRKDIQAIVDECFELYGD